MSDAYQAFCQAVKTVFPGGFTLRDEANAIVAIAFRNGPLEDLHAGKPSELLKDSTLSRITDDEMQLIMINACQHVERLLREKQEDPGAYYMKIMGFNRQFCQNWER